MMRYRLRTLLIVLAVGPAVLAGAWFTVDAYRQRLLDTGYDEPDPQVGYLQMTPVVQKASPDEN